MTLGSALSESLSDECLSETKAKSPRTMSAHLSALSASRHVEEEWWWWWLVRKVLVSAVLGDGESGSVWAGQMLAEGLI